MLDVLIKNGLVVDGTGKPAYQADVAVKDGKIQKIAPHIAEPAKEVINAKGLVVAPGFIDCHNHSDSDVFLGTDSYNYLEQGVTTQVCGHCGETPAPYYSGAMLRLKAYLPEERFAQIVQQAATPTSFMKTAEQASIGANMAFFLGHNNIRGSVMDFSPDRPDGRQLAAMQAHIEEAMEQGYLGYSTGLIYAPSVYADTRELIDLAKVMAPYGGIYASHIRGEGNNVVQAVTEAIQIGEEAGVQVQISHLKVIGLHNEGKAETLLRLIEDANARGVRVYADQYPYNAGSAPLRSRIPPKYHVGGLQALLERMKDPQIRKQMDHSIFHEADEFESCIYSAGYDGSLIASLPNNPELVGMTIGQLARKTGEEPIDVLCRILIENDGVAQGIYFNQSASDMMRIMGSKWVFGGSDSSNYPDERYDPQTYGGRHLRGTTTMVRRLELQRDFNLCAMEEAIHRITGAPAAALKLEGQGVLREGNDASITVLDYENLHARASYAYPYRENEGIHYVLVNGAAAVRNGRCTGTRSGKLLRRKA